MGNAAADCAKQLDEAGVDVIGANCGSLSPIGDGRNRQDDGGSHR